MNHKHFVSFAAVPLLSLMTACSERATDAPQKANEGTATSSGIGTLTRLEGCEMDDTTDSRIRELVANLAELRIRYTEGHPDVIATKRALDELEQAALGDCVERLQ